MSAPDSSFLDKARQWTAYADEDLRLAEHALKIGDEAPFRLIAYHAQQCAEKYLKSYLVMRAADFPFTHNIARLLELCSRSGLQVEAIRNAEELTPYAITTRYPGEEEEVSKDEAASAIGIARNVRQLVRDALAKERAIERDTDTEL